jgi:outer membrane lipoprotein SlyB
MSMSSRLLAFAILPAALLSACVTTSTTSTTWGEPTGSGWARPGRVASIRENVTTQQGNPAAGAAAGAVIGGLLGAVVGGHRGYDRYGNVVTVANPGAAAVGAVTGAAVGAAASQGSGQRRSYEVYVRFDDGGAETYVYPDQLPFQVGDYVALTEQGLVRR